MRMLPSRTWLACLLAVVTLHASGAAAQRTRFELVEVAQYGWPELADSTRAMNHIERRLSGGVLGVVASIAEGPDGEVVVLDRANHKVVIFSRDGQLIRVIAGGSGRGPGEFVRAHSMDVASDGRIAVFDIEQRRITLFSFTGELLATIHPERGLTQIAFDRDRLFATAYPLDGEEVLVWEVDLTSGTLIPALRGDPAEAHLHAYGEVGQFGRQLDGRLLYAFPSPGRWSRFGDDGASSPVGTQFFPWLRGTVGGNQQTGPIRSVALGTRGIGTLRTGHVLIVHWVYPSREPRRFPTDPGTGFVGNVLTSGGDLVQRFQLSSGEEIWRHFLVSRLNGDLLVGKLDPYPRVVRYEIRQH